MAYRNVNEGDRVGEYILDEKLGEGRGTEVWRARHHVLGSPARVKVARTEAASRALNTAGVVQHAVPHPRSLEVIGLNLESDPPYFVTELIEGETLRALLDREGSLPWERSAPILHDLLEYLGALHEKGRIHGNLKPSNVLVDAAGRARLTDPGPAEAHERDDDLVSGVLEEEETDPAGPSEYHPPAGGEHGVSADLWGAGVILFEILAGRRPQGAEAPSDLVESLPPQVDAAYRCACTRSQGRFASAAEMSAALAGDAPRADPGPEPDPKAVTVISSSARCSSCGRTNRVEYRFCIHCGSPLGARKKAGAVAVCGSCGKPRFSNYRFCPYCGTRYGN